MLILSLAYHVYQLDTRQYGLSPTERFKSRHQLYPSFDVTVCSIRLFRSLLCLTLMLSSADLPALSVASAAVFAPLLSMVTGHFRFIVVADGLAKETQCCAGIPPGCKQEVDGLTLSINRAVQIFSLPPDFDIRFVHSPPATHGTFVPAKRPVQPGYQRTHWAITSVG